MPAATQDRRSTRATLPDVIAPGWDGIQHALTAIRAHLNMDVAFVSQFIGDSRVFRFVDADGPSPIRPGDRSRRDEGYCAKVVDGRLPQLIPDTARCTEALAIDATERMPIGAHLSVPLRLGDGCVFGTLCCFSFKPDPTLNQRDLNLLAVFADLVAGQIGGEIERERRRSEIVGRIEEMLAAGEPRIVYQPVWALEPMRLDGAEALSRFRFQPVRTPDIWFAEADEAALRTPLEIQAIRNALEGFGPAWDRQKLHLGLNSAPQTILEGTLAQVLDGYPGDRLVLEITEHAEVDDYGALRRALDPLRARGIRVAVDDAGSGYASMRHILNIRPDIIKLDLTLTQGIDTDATRRALARALISFGRETGARLVAEGVETASELDTLRQLGVHAAQGYHLGHPMPLPDFMRLRPQPQRMMALDGLI